jgi:hypothetical protein
MGKGVLLQLCCFYISLNVNQYLNPFALLGSKKPLSEIASAILYVNIDVPLLANPTISTLKFSQTQGLLFSSLLFYPAYTLIIEFSFNKSSGGIT